MRRLLCIFSFFFLVGCQEEQINLVAFINATKAQHVPSISPLKKPPKFEHFAYQAELLRSPFIVPSRSMREDNINSAKDCLLPDFKRLKGKLENFAIDNLTMRGTLQEKEKIWALIQTTDNSVHRVGIGDFLGLYQGKITKVSLTHIDVMEYVPDGAGCYIERLSKMELAGK